MRSVAASVYNRVRHPAFERIAREAGGMMTPSAYAQLDRMVAAAGPGDVIEVGGATGAGSVVIGRAMAAAGSAGRLVVVERCEGGSRSEHGGRDENLARIEAHLARFGVGDRTVVWPHELTFENGDEVLALAADRPLAGLVHDADGRIDRDFALFWSHLEPGAFIVVDDYEPEPRFRPVTERHPFGGMKGHITYRLLEAFVEWGLFERVIQVRATVFGRKPVGASFERFDLDACAALVAEVEAAHTDWLRTQTRT
jgi:predicted O-methyltransferase YrrM